MPPPKLPDSPFVPRAGNTPHQPEQKRGAKFDRLNALFGGGGGGGAGGAPGGAGARPFGPKGGLGGAGAMESRMRTERLRAANTQDELEAACDALLKHFTLPEEPDLLCKMLGHRDLGVGERALAELGSLKARGRFTPTISMKEMLTTFGERVKEPNAARLVQDLLS